MTVPAPLEAQSMFPSALTVSSAQTFAKQAVVTVEVPPAAHVTVACAAVWVYPEAQLVAVEGVPKVTAPLAAIVPPPVSTWMVAHVLATQLVFDAGSM